MRQLFPLALLAATSSAFANPFVPVRVMCRGTVVQHQMCADQGMVWSDRACSCVHTLEETEPAPERNIGWVDPGPFEEDSICPPIEPWTPPTTPVYFRIDEERTGITNVETLVELEGLQYGALLDYLEIVDAPLVDVLNDDARLDRDSP